MFKKISLVVLAGIALGGCQVTTGPYHYGPRYDPYYMRTPDRVTYQHTDPYRYRPFVSSPVCHTHRVYHPGYGTRVERRCFN